MPDREYTAADITVLRFDESVRQRPGMYFGAGPTDPTLATRILETVTGHAFHPAAAVAPYHHPVVLAEVTADLTFTVTDDQPSNLLTEDGVLRLHREGTLLMPDRWAATAAAALSTRTVIEIWQNGTAYRQPLSGHHPVEPPTPFPPPPGTGTRVTFHLDPDFLDPGRRGSPAITADLSTVNPHGPDCIAPAQEAGHVLLRDLRAPGHPTEFRHI